jgi:hypothetical protein
MSKSKQVESKSRHTYGYSDYWYVTYKDGSFEFIPVRRGKTKRTKRLNKRQ